MNKNDLLYANRKSRSLNRIKEIVKDKITFELADFYNTKEFSKAMNEVVAGELSPYRLAQKIVNIYKSKN